MNLSWLCGADRKIRPSGSLFGITRHSLVITNNDSFYPHLTLMKDSYIPSYRIRKSEVFAWDKHSYLTHVISPQKETFHVYSVCNGCIGCHAIFSLGWRCCDVTMTSNVKMPYVNVIVCGIKCYFKIKHSKSKVLQEKNQTWVFGADRKLLPSRSLFCITRQSLLMPNSNPRDEFSIRTSHPCKILIISALSSSSEVTTILNRTKTGTKTKSKARLNTKRRVIKITKIYKIRTRLGPPYSNDQ